MGADTQPRKGYVFVYDHEHPEAPVELLEGNFTPRRYLRWKYRPSAQPMRHGSDLGAPEDVVKVLRRTDLGATGTPLDLVMMGVEGLTATKGVGEASARMVFEWFLSTVAGRDAAAELAATKQLTAVAETPEVPAAEETQPEPVAEADADTD